MSTKEITSLFLVAMCMLISSAYALDKDTLLDMEITAQVNNVASLNTLQFKATFEFKDEYPLGERRTVTGPKPGVGKTTYFDEEITADDRSGVVEVFVKNGKIRVDKFVNNATMTLKNGSTVKNEHLVFNEKIVYLGDKALYRMVSDTSAYVDPTRFTSSFFYINLLPPGLQYKVGMLNADEALAGMKQITTQIEVEETGNLMMLTKQATGHPMWERVSKTTLDLDKGSLPIVFEAWRKINGTERLTSRLAENELINCGSVWIPVSRTSTLYSYSIEGELRHKMTVTINLDRDSILVNQELSDNLFTFDGLGTEPTEKIIDFTVDPPIVFNPSRM